MRGLGSFVLQIADLNTDNFIHTIKPVADLKLGAGQRLNADQADHGTFSVPVEGRSYNPSTTCRLP